MSSQESVSSWVEKMTPVGSTKKNEVHSSHAHAELFQRGKPFQHKLLRGCKEFSFGDDRLPGMLRYANFFMHNFHFTRRFAAKHKWKNDGSH